MWWYSVLTHHIFYFYIHISKWVDFRLSMWHDLNNEDLGPANPGSNYFLPVRQNFLIPSTFLFLVDRNLRLWLAHLVRYCPVLYDVYLRREKYLTEKNSSAYACASCCFTWPITTSLLGPLADPGDGEENESMAVQIRRDNLKREFGPVAVSARVKSRQLTEVLRVCKFVTGEAVVNLEEPCRGAMSILHWTAQNEAGKG